MCNTEHCPKQCGLKQCNKHWYFRFYIHLNYLCLSRPESYTDDLELAEGLSDGKGLINVEKGNIFLLCSLGYTRERNLINTVLWERPRPYILPDIFQFLTEFSFRFRFSSSVQVIPFRHYKIQVWTVWRSAHDCQCSISFSKSEPLHPVPLPEKDHSWSSFFGL